MILGNRQRGVFLPIAAAFAPLAANLIGKITGRGKRKRAAKKQNKTKKQIKINYPKIKFTKNDRHRQ